MAVAESVMENLYSFTLDFLTPFAIASAMENDGTNTSTWMIEGQKILLDATEEEMANLEVRFLFYIFFILRLPILLFLSKIWAMESQELTWLISVRYVASGTILLTIPFLQPTVSTLCQPQYESSVADADIFLSAKVIKVMK